MLLGFSLTMAVHVVLMRMDQLHFHGLFPLYEHAMVSAGYDPTAVLSSSWYYAEVGWFGPFYRGAGLWPSLVAGVVIALVMFLFYRLILRLWRLAARWLIRLDGRKPILFLRSFSDDFNKHNSVRLAAQSVSHAGTHGGGPGEAVELYGPLVAIGQPGQTLPHLGSYRLKFSDAEWQPAVLKMMEEAAIIVIMVGTSPWVRWEIEQVALHHYLDKTLLFFPTGGTMNATGGCK